MPSKMTRRGFGAGLLVLTAATAVPAAAGERLIEGEVIYRERMALPPGAQVELTLEDVSRADSRAPVVASAVMPAGAGSPIGFRMKLPDNALDPRKTYALRARITVDGRAWFGSTQHVAVPPAGEKVTIPVQRIAETDAAGVTPYGTWILNSIAGKPVAEGVTSDLTLDDSHKAYGAGGCNRFTGSFSFSGETLTFGPIASTNMACVVAGMEQEARLHAAFRATTGFALRKGGNELLLHDAGGKETARLTRLNR